MELEKIIENLKEQVREHKLRQEKENSANPVFMPEASGLRSIALFEHAPDHYEIMDLVLTETGIQVTRTTRFNNRTEALQEQKIRTINQFIRRTT